MGRLIKIGLVICIAAAVAVVGFHFFKRGAPAQEPKATRETLLAENTFLKDKIDSLQELIDQNKRNIEGLQRDKRIFEDQAAVLRQENEKIKKFFRGQINDLKRKHFVLRKKIRFLENVPLLQRIKDALQGEENENVKNLLEKTLNKIEQIKEGKAVDLETIVVNPQGKTGMVLSIDYQNNLIVINMGTKDGLKEGDKIKIMQDSFELARAEIVSLRYNIGAAFVDDIYSARSIKDLKEGNQVFLVTD